MVACRLGDRVGFVFVRIVRGANDQLALHCRCCRSQTGEIASQKTGNSGARAAGLLRRVRRRMR